MGTPRQSTSNRQNSKRSTGPRTESGRAAASRNAVSHGLGSTAVVVPGERREDWEAHLVGIISSLAPVGLIEEELAKQIAHIIWRERRVIRYEADVMSGRRSADGSELECEKEKATNDYDSGVSEGIAPIIMDPKMIHNVIRYEGRLSNLLRQKIDMLLETQALRRRGVQPTSIL
jgi:hypothetical protein